MALLSIAQTSFIVEKNLMILKIRHFTENLVIFKTNNLKTHWQRLKSGETDSQGLKTSLTI
jgi:hypothetical protein